MEDSIHLVFAASAKFILSVADSRPLSRSLSSLVSVEGFVPRDKEPPDTDFTDFSPKNYDFLNKS